MKFWKEINKINENYHRYKGIEKFYFGLVIFGMASILSLIIDSKIVGMAFMIAGVFLIIANFKENHSKSETTKTKVKGRKKKTIA